MIQNKLPHQFQPSPLPHRDNRLIYDTTETPKDREASQPAEVKQNIIKGLEKVKDSPNGQTLQNALQDFLRNDGELIEREIRQLALQIQGALAAIDPTLRFPQELLTHATVLDIMEKAGLARSQTLDSGKKEKEELRRAIEKADEQKYRITNERESIRKETRRRGVRRGRRMVHPTRGEPDPTAFRKTLDALREERLKAYEEGRQLRDLFKEKFGITYGEYLKELEEERKARIQPMVEKARSNLAQSRERAREEEARKRKANAHSLNVMRRFRGYPPIGHLPPTEAIRAQKPPPTETGGRVSRVKSIIEEIREKEAKTPSGIFGSVSEVRGNFVEITWESKSNARLEKGQILHIYRTEGSTRYLDKATVVAVNGNQAVIERLRMTIRPVGRGDRITSRFDDQWISQRVTETNAQVASTDKPEITAKTLEQAATRQLADEINKNPAGNFRVESNGTDIIVKDLSGNRIGYCRGMENGLYEVQLEGSVPNVVPAGQLNREIADAIYRIITSPMGQEVPVQGSVEEPAPTPQVEAIPTPIETETLRQGNSELQQPSPIEEVANRRDVLKSRTEFLCEKIRETAAKSESEEKNQLLEKYARDLRQTLLREPLAHDLLAVVKKSFETPLTDAEGNRYDIAVPSLDDTKNIIKLQSAFKLKKVGGGAGARPASAE
jgi:hypothetical protein